MIRRLSILAILALAGCQPALALDVTVQAGTAISNIQVAITATMTSAPPHIITVMPGAYPLFNYQYLTNGIIRSISGELTGYGSAADTLCGTNAGGPATALGLNTAGTIQGIGFTVLRGQLTASSSKFTLFRNCRFTDIGSAGVYGGIGNGAGSFIGCEFIRCIGLDVLLDIPLVANCVFIACEGLSTYASIIRGDNNTRTYLTEGNTFVACKVAGNNGLVNSYGSTTMVMRNNSITYTNVHSVKWGGSLPLDAGGNVSNGATFFNPPTGYGTNAVIAGVDLRLVPNCPAWAAGVFTNAPWYAAGSNTATDIRGMNYRGVTNNSSGAYWQSPLQVEQFRGVFTP